MRTPKDPLTVTRHNVTLDPVTVKTLTEVGEGNLSAGIRIAARAYKAVIIGEVPLWPYPTGWVYSHDMTKRYRVDANDKVICENIKGVQND